MNQTRDELAGVLRGAPAKIWLRFYAPRPEGSQIPVVERNDEAVETRQRREAQDQGIDPDRLKRPGIKPDSGRQIVRDVRMVCVIRLLDDLQRRGYYLVQSFANETRRTDSPGMKSVVTFIFSCEGEKIALAPVDQEWLDWRVAGTYDHLAIFANPKRDGDEGSFTRREDTINVRGMKSGETPRYFTRMRQPGHYSHEDR